MSLKKSLKNFILNNALLRKIARKAVYSSQRSRYMKTGKDVPVEKNLIAFCSFDGRNYADSPRAVFEYVKESEKFRGYRFVWIFDDPEKYSFLKDERTYLVKSGTAECDRFVQRAGYWVFNFRAPDRYVPKEGQVYIQCWHGTPLKRLGYDITAGGNAMNSVSEIKEKYRTDAERFDYMVSPCSFVTEKFISAWDLKKQGMEDAVLEIGYPRNDRLVLAGEAGEDISSVREALGLPEDKKVILYAPTWRDDQHDADIGYIYDNPVDFDYLRERLGDEYVILFRAHYLVASSFDFAAYEGFVYDVSDYDDINDLYLISDILITDYSSVFFDYALLERPMYFYMYDMESYASEIRGFYIDVDELPGPVVKTEKELADAVISDEGRRDLTDFNREYNTWNDGRSSERLAEIISGGRK